MIKIEEVSAKKAAKLIEDNPKMGILDIRMKMEYEEGHLKNARLIDFYDDDFEEKIAKLPRNKKYLLYCRSGARTREAFSIFDRLGFKKIYHLTYGTLDWLGENLKLEK